MSGPRLPPRTVGAVELDAVRGHSGAGNLGVRGWRSDGGDFDTDTASVVSVAVSAPVSLPRTARPPPRGTSRAAGDHAAALVTMHAILQHAQRVVHALRECEDALAAARRGGLETVWLAEQAARLRAAHTAQRPIVAAVAARLQLMHVSGDVTRGVQGLSAT